MDAAGYAPLELTLTLTETLEEVSLSLEGSAQVGREAVVLAMTTEDPRKGDFLSRLQTVRLKTPQGDLKNVLTASAGGLYSDTVYTVADGKITLRKGFFTEAGTYTLYLQAAGYPVKHLDITVEQAQENSGNGGQTQPGDGGQTNPKDNSQTNPGDNGQTNPGDNNQSNPGGQVKAESPAVEETKKVNKFFYTYVNVAFKDMDAEDLETYLKEVQSVTLNGEDL